MTTPGVQPGVWRVPVDEDAEDEVVLYPFFGAHACNDEHGPEGCEIGRQQHELMVAAPEMFVALLRCCQVIENDVRLLRAHSEGYEGSSWQLDAIRMARTALTKAGYEHDAPLDEPLRDTGFIDAERFLRAWEALQG